MAKLTPPIESLDLLYEILLWRVPGPQEIDFWSKYVNSNPALGVRGLAEGIMGSEEFISKHPRPILPSIDDSIAEYSVNGHRLLLPLNDVVYANARRTGKYEPHVSKAITDRLRQGSVFLDIGSNVGVHSVAAASRVGAHGMVYAVDASVENCAILNKSALRFAIENIVVVPLAVGAAPAIENISTSNDSSNKWVRKEGGAGFQKIFVTTLDSIFTEVPRLDLIKIDVEGRESGVLRGAKKIIERSRCAIFAEYLGRSQNLYANTEGHFSDDLVALGYEVSVVEEGGSLYRLDGSASSLEEAVTRQRSLGGDHIDLLFEPRGRRSYQ